MPTYQQNSGSSDLLPEGAYPFIVRNAEDVTSANGNEMIRLTLEVNNAVQIVDHLVFVRSAYWKIDQFRVCTGEVLGAAGSNASLEADDCIARKGAVFVGVEQWDGRNRNKITEYLDPATNTVSERPERPKVVVDAGVPTAKPYKPRPDLRPEPNDIPF
jgi:hypothetical protein